MYNKKGNMFFFQNKKKKHDFGGVPLSVLYHSFKSETIDKNNLTENSTPPKSFITLQNVLKNEIETKPHTIECLKLVQEKIISIAYSNKFIK